MYVCRVCYVVAAATCPWLRPDGVINKTSTAQGCSTGLDAAQTASQTDDWQACTGRLSVTSPTCSHAYVRLGVLEDEERQGEVVLGQADQIVFEQGFGCTFSPPLAPVQEWNHPLEGVLHVALAPGLMRNKHPLLHPHFQSLEIAFKLHV